MELSIYALDKLVDFVSGDNGLTLKRNGPDLVKFFNKYGERDTYDFNNGGLPKVPGRDICYSRKDYVKSRIRKINKTINLKKIIEEITNSSNDKSNTAVKINEIILPEKFKLELVGDDFVIIGNIKTEDKVVVEVTFEEIQSQIIQELDKAKFIIWIAMAWFTDKVLFEKLIVKKKQGLNIQIIISDDVINRQTGLDFETNFETKRIEKTAYDNLMHNKFCIIDLTTVINGSYNWSNKAKYNNENITITHSYEFAGKFAAEFMRIKMK